MSEEEYEIDLRKVIRKIAARKRIIISWTILITLIAGLIIFVTSSGKTYKSNATLIIYYSSQARIEDEMFNDIFLTNDVLKNIIIKLDLKTASGKTLLPDQLRDRLKVEGISTSWRFTTTVAGNIKFPVMSTINLTATAQTPEMAQALVNQWAKEIVQNSSAVFGDVQIRANLKKMKARVANTEADFNNIEKQYIQFNQKNNMLSISTRIGILKDKISSLEHSAQDLKDKINYNKALRKEVQARMASMEDGSRWVGLFLSKTENSDNALKNKIISIRDDLKNTSDLVSAFRIKSRLDFRQKNLKALKDNLLEYNKELLNTQVELAVAKDRKDNILKEMKGKQLYIPVAKGISDETVWNQIISGNNDFDKLKGVKIVSQSLNPIYMELQKSLSSINIDYFTLKMKVKHLQKQVKELSGKITAEEEQIQKDRLQLEDYDKILGVLNPLYKKFQKQYLDLQEQAIDLNTQISMQQAKLDYTLPDLNQKKKELKKLEIEYQKQSAEREKLVAKYNIVKNAYIDLIKEIKQAETSLPSSYTNIVVHSKGNLPDRAEPRGRLMKLGIAFVVALFFGIFMAIMNYYFSEEEK